METTDNSEGNSLRVGEDKSRPKLKWSVMQEEVSASDDGITEDREKFFERVITIDDDHRIAEGVSCEYKVRYKGEDHWEDAQQHIIGYHYFVLQRKVSEKEGGEWKDIEGFQGNVMRPEEYRYFIYATTPLKKIDENLSYYDAVNLFNERNALKVIPDNEIRKKALELGIVHIRQGECPECGSTNLDYDAMELGEIGDQVYYPFLCKNCGFNGREWYKLEFVAFTDENGNEIKEEE